MPNGFALSTPILPFRVVSTVKLDGVVPLVRSHYRTFIPTTNDSAPVPRIGTLTLAESIHPGFSLNIGATGS
ncbi:MAG: hypothetical protein NVSMB62_28710 [Acidobacteriaceae bacterium]